MIEWISVSDSLPKKEDTVVICLINGKPIVADVQSSAFSFRKDAIIFYWPENKWIKNDYYSEITHWMRVPELKKEKDE